MAVVKFGAHVHTMKGRQGGSIFRTNTYGTVLYSNNWQKRMCTPKFYQTRASFSALSSQWKSLTQAEQQSWYAQTRYWQVDNNYTSPADGSDKTSSHGLFSQINSKLQQTIPKKTKPPKMTNEPFYHKTEYISNADFTSVQLHRLGSFLWIGQVVVWAGPFCPVWKLYPTIFAKIIGSFSIPIPGTQTLDCSGFWQNNFGDLPTDPGYLQFGGQYFYLGPGYNQDASSLYMWIVPVNGAPPYTA
jgi:hypothetical protein